MAQATTTPPEDRGDRIMTTITGWSALLIGVISIHRWVLTGTTVWGIFAGDAWARTGIALSFVLFLMWAWGYHKEANAWLGNWVRNGGINALAVTLGLLMVLVAANVWVRRQVMLKADLTKNKRFTLSARSREIVKQLNQPLQVTLFMPAGRSNARARDLFRQYGDASSKFHWKHVDPLVDQKTYLEKQPKLGGDFTAAVLEYGEKREDVTDFTEKGVTSAILKLTRSTTRKLLFLKGHGEADIAGATSPAESMQQVLTDLRDTRWTVESVELYSKDAKALDPAEVAVLVIPGPKRDFAAIEQTRITDYLNKGGDVLLMLNLEGPPLAPFLKDWGVVTTNDVVLGEAQGGLIVTQADNTSHASVKAGSRVIFPPLRSVKAVSPSPAGLTLTELVNSGGQSQVFANFVPRKPLDTRDAKPGPVGIAMLAEKSVGSGETAGKARLMVFGGHNWFTDQWTSVSIFFNRDLALSVLNYLGEEEALVAIPPKDENTEQAFLTPDKARELLLVNFAYFPLLALMLSIVVYLKRR